MNHAKFVGKVVSELLNDNFSVFLHQEDNVNDCAGWFDGTKKEFIVAMRGSDGLPTLIHEYCHYLQWRDRKRYYNRLVGSVNNIFSWLGGKFYRKNVLDKAVMDAIELEWDCEMMALDIIKKYELDVDIQRYLRQSNAYLMFYHVIRETRKWCKASPYNPEIVRSMPDELKPLEYYQNRDNIKDHQWEKYLKVIK